MLSSSIAKAFLSNTPDVLYQKFIFLMGPPGIGKRRWAQRLQKDLDFLYLSTTGAFRNILQYSSGKGLQRELIEQIRAVIRSGGVITDELLTQMIRQKSVLPEARKGMIIEGFPRNKHQLTSFLETFRLEAVINLTMQDDILCEQIVGRRYCLPCQNRYNVSSINRDGYELEPVLPKQGGRCDQCGGELVRREGDMEGVAMAKIKEYRVRMAPLLEQLGQIGMLQTVELKRGIEVEYGPVLAVLKSRLRA